MKTKPLTFTKEQVTQIVGDLKASGQDNSSLMKIFLEAMMNAEREEYKIEHNDSSNGFRSRKAFGQGRIMELKVPRTRHGNFYPVLLTVLKHQREEMDRIGFMLYNKGLTTEQVGEVFGEIYGRSYSKQSISRMADMAREEVLSWLERPLEPYYPIIYVDCTFVPVRRNGAVRKEAYYSILGVLPDRTREVLALVAHPTESAIGWRAVLQSLRERGVREIGLVVSDGLSGIEDAVAAEFTGADHQLCVVHLMRSMTKKVANKDREQLINDLREVFQDTAHETNPEHVYGKFRRLCEKWGRHYRSINRMVNDSRYEMYFTYIKYHHSIRSMVYSTNWIERLNKDYKRVLRMRGALPNEKAVLVLLGAVAIQKKAYHRKLPKINNETRYFRWE